MFLLPGAGLAGGGVASVDEVFAESSFSPEGSGSKGAALNKGSATLAWSG
jgi:hypothetical protein